MHELIIKVQRRGLLLIRLTQESFHYLQDQISKDEAPVKTFWMTYNSYDLNKVINTFNWKDPNKKYLDLPSKFHHLFE